MSEGRPALPSSRIPRRRLGTSAVELPVFGLGCAPLGNLRETISDTTALAVVDRAWDLGVRFFDTSPWYGRGLSELRLGQALRRHPRGDYVLSTKVGRTFHRPADPANFTDAYWTGGLPFEHRFDYTYDGVMRSYEQSLMRLGLNTIDILLIHDLDREEHGSQALVDHHLRDLERSGWRALDMLRRTGEARAVGAGANIPQTIADMLSRFDLDFFLVAMPYTLLDQSALTSAFPLCEGRSTGLIVGAPFASGILATGSAHPAPIYNYAPASAGIIDKTRRIEAICGEFGVSLQSAALQFPLRHAAVASVLAGAVAPGQVTQNLTWHDVPIPEGFWSALRTAGLIHPDAP